MENNGLDKIWIAQYGNMLCIGTTNGGYIPDGAMVASSRELDAINDMKDVFADTEIKVASKVKGEIASLPMPYKKYVLLKWLLYGDNVFYNIDDIEKRTNTLFEIFSLNNRLVWGKKGFFVYDYNTSDQKYHLVVSPYKKVWKLLPHNIILNGLKTCGNLDIHKIRYSDVLIEPWG